ncbi:MAG TPA: ribosomal protein S18-alanine N-acetyltransferase [Longimicrobiaceae bacterium]
MTATEPTAIFLLRDLRIDDLPRILEIEQASFSTPWRRSTFEGLLRRADADLIGATLEGRLVGYAISWTILDQAELGNVAVGPEVRQRGLGRTLVEASLQRVRQRGARECFLEVRESNHVARRLYETLGFTVIGRRRRYYSHPVEDALVMRIELGRAGHG